MVPAEPDEETGIHCRLDELVADRGMTLTRLSAICRVLHCDVGDLLGVEEPRS